MSGNSPNADDDPVENEPADDDAPTNDEPLADDDAPTNDEPLADDDAPTNDEPLADDDAPTPADVREELYGERGGSSGPGGIDTERSVGQFDEGVVEVLSWGLDTETRARIYVRLRQRPWATSEEVATDTGLYPSTVREALAALYDEEVVERRKRASGGAGNDPYEYTAIAPSELVGTLAERVQERLNAVFAIGRSSHDSGTTTTDSTARHTTEPVTITVRDAEDDAAETDDEGDDATDE